MQQDTLTQSWWRGRRVQLSGRGLMVVVLVLGVVLGWVVRHAQIQRDVVAAIEQGGTEGLIPSKDRLFRQKHRPDVCAVTRGDPATLVLAALVPDDEPDLTDGSPADRLI